MIELIREHQAAPNPDQQVFLNEQGEPLVRVDMSRKDAIYSCWKRTMVQVDVQNLGFRFLRKTGADWIKQRYGLEVPEMYLSHKEAGGKMSAYYANRRWHLLHEALDTFGYELPFLG